MLSTREKNFAALSLLILIGAILVYSVRSSHRFAAETEILNPKMILSRDSYLQGSDAAYAAFDKNPQTSWTENLYSPDGQKAYITAELGLTHFPGRPPVENLPSELIILNGNQKNRELFRQYARLRTVRLMFFTQEKVDADRENRLPGPLEFWAEKTVTLPDRTEPAIIPLHFLKSRGPSQRFPSNVHQIWLRMEVIDIYPGTVYRQTFAVSEIDYRSPLRDHRELSL